MSNEKERALLEQEKEFQKQLQEVRDEYNEKIKALLDKLDVILQINPVKFFRLNRPKLARIPA